MPVITFENVTKTYPGQKRPALKDVSATIEDGEFVFLVGPSGSGKSTFLRLVLREYRATQGSVVVNGRDVGKLRNWRIPKLRRGVGIVFQDFRLLPGKSVTENVAFTGENPEVADAAAVRSPAACSEAVIPARTRCPPATRASASSCKVSSWPTHEVNARCTRAPAASRGHHSLALSVRSGYPTPAFARAITSAGSAVQMNSS